MGGRVIIKQSTCNNYSIRFNYLLYTATRPKTVQPLVSILYFVAGNHQIKFRWYILRNVCYFSFCITNFDPVGFHGFVRKG